MISISALYLGVLSGQTLWLLQLITKPVISQMSGGILLIKTGTSLVYEKIAANQTEGFVNLLSLLNVKYILQRNDISWNYQRQHGYFPELIKSFLSSQTDITLKGFIRGT